MHREIYKHKVAYLILVLGLISLVIAFMGAWPNTQLQRVLITVLGVFYFGWGVVTHRISGNLSRKIFEEYGVVALLATGMLLIITF